jgi:hypothetical protein
MKISEIAEEKFATSLTEIGYADDLGDLNIPESEIISAAQQAGTIFQKPVMVFARGIDELYFFTENEKISTLILLSGDSIKAIKNNSNKPGLMLALVNYLVHFKNLTLKVLPDDDLTPSGLRWLSILIKRPRGLTITDFNGNAIDVEKLSAEWSKSKSLGGTWNGDTGILIRESNIVWKNKLIKNENSLMPYIIFDLDSEAD